MHMHSFATCDLMRLLSGFEVFFLFSTPAVVFLLICSIAQKRENESENFCYNSLRIFRAIGENIPELIPRFERHSWEELCGCKPKRISIRNVKLTGQGCTFPGLM